MSAAVPAPRPRSDDPADAADRERRARDARLRLIQSTYEGGFHGLVFPAALEREFRRTTHAYRLRLSFGFALLGALAFVWTDAASGRLLPDLAAWLPPVRLAVAVAVSLLIAVCWCYRDRDRVWPQEHVATIGCVAAAALWIWAVQTSQAFTAATHSFAVVVLICYPTILVRQRFWYACFTSALVWTVYMGALPYSQGSERIVLVHGALLLTLAIALALGANYLYERDERRRFLMARLDAYRRADLSRTNARLEQLAGVDMLTGLGNRRCFDARLDSVWAQARGAGRSLALLFVDVDHFKAYNDHYGHPAGDACLREIAARLEAVATRHRAAAFRLGGEEFALVVGPIGAHSAIDIAEQVRAAIVRAHIPHEASPVSQCVTVSVGVATTAPSRYARDTRSALFQRADGALYRAKSSGRNEVAFVARGDRDLAHGTRQRAGQESHRRPTDGIGTHGRIDTALDAERRRPHCRLRFTADIERLYRRCRSRRRARELEVFSLMGGVLFNLYWVCSVALIADVRALALLWCLPASLLILSIVPIARLPVAPVWREWLHIAPPAAVAVGSIAICAQSEAITAMSLAAATLFIPFFTVVIGRATLGCASSLLALTLLSFYTLMPEAAPMQALVKHDYLSLLSLMSVFVTIACYRLERARRRQFLDRLVLRHRARRLKFATQKLRRLSTSDPLTGIGNRRRFTQRLRALWTQIEADRIGVGLLVLDVDQFKQYNDHYGHEPGDRCLLRVANALAALAGRYGGEVFRIGGDEFAMLVGNVDAAGVRDIASHACAQIAALAIPHAASEVEPFVSLSVGASLAGPPGGPVASALVRAADAALYRAKRAGRACSAFEPVDYARTAAAGARAGLIRA